MARGNTYRCAACDKTFEFCPSCQISKLTYDAERYCSQSHAEIFDILSKHGCGLTTAEETLDALANYNTNGLKPSVQAHIDSLKPAKKVKARKEVVSNEETAQE